MANEKNKPASQAATKSEPAKTATDTQAAPPAAKAEPAKELTSEKLVNLELQYHDAKANARKVGMEKPDSKEEEEAWQASYVIKKQIDAEKLALIQEQKNLAIQERRNAVKAEVDALLSLSKKQDASVGDDKMTVDEKNAISADFNKLYDSIVNRLNGGAPIVKAATTATNGTAKEAGTRGATTNAIRAIIAPLFAQGMSGSDVRKVVIKDNGFNDGTANSVILNYEYELGLKTPPVKD